MRPAVAVALAAAAIAAAGCGSSSDSADPAEVVPAQAPLYLEIDRDPPESQDEAAEQLEQKLAAGAPLGERLARFFDSQVPGRSGRLSYDRDIESWIGDRVALFVPRVGIRREIVSTALVAAAEDEEEAKDALERRFPDGLEREYRGTAYRRDGTVAAGIVDGFVVVGTENAFEGAVDASKDGEALAGAEAFRSARDEAPGDRVAFAYGRGVRGLERAGFPNVITARLLGLFSRPSVTTVRLTPDGAVAESRLEPEDEVTAGVLGGSGARMALDVPADSWFVLGQRDLGRTGLSFLTRLGGAAASRSLQRAVRSLSGLDLRRDVLPWAGDGALYLNGTADRPDSGGIVIEIRRPRLARRALARVESVLRARGLRIGHPLTERRQGFGIYPESGPFTEFAHTEFVLEAGRVRVATESGKVPLGRGGGLGGYSPFQEVADPLGDDHALATYIDVGEALQALQGFDPALRSFGGATAYLEPFDKIAVGTTREGDAVVVRANFVLR